MADMLDYLAWRGDIEFTQMPVNPVDALIFSTLSYIDFKDIVPDNPMQSISMAEAAAGLFSLAEPQNRTRVKKDLELLEAVAKSARFDNIRLSFYRSILIPEEETQFAAVTIFLEDGSAYIAFRGTDNTLTGWKEDFNMTFQPDIPAQRLALEYVQEFAAAHPIPIWMGGHSKGGNLSVYAAAKCGELLQQETVSQRTGSQPPTLHRLEIPDETTDLLHPRSTCGFPRWRGENLLRDQAASAATSSPTPGDHQGTNTQTGSGYG